MARVSTKKRNDLEAFWRAHIRGWRESTLNQREYCEAHGLPLKRFGNWRAKFRHEDPRFAGRLLYRRSGAASTETSTGTKDISPATWIPSGRSANGVRRRDFSKADKRRIVAEASRDGASVSGVAKKYGIAPSVVFRWRRDLAEEQQRATAAPAFAQVELSDAPNTGLGPLAPAAAQAAAPVIVERSSPGIEVELKGGRRVRFDRETDPEAIRTLVTLLEGAGQ